MRRKSVKSVLAMDERTRTVPVLLNRLREIQHTLNRVAGVMKSVTRDRMIRNGTYWENTLDGWADHLRELGSELVLIQTQLMRLQIEE